MKRLVLAVLFPVLAASCGTDVSSLSPDAISTSDTGTIVDSGDSHAPLDYLPTDTTTPDPGPSPTVTITSPERGVFATGCGQEFPIEFLVDSSNQVAAVYLQGQSVAPTTGASSAGIVTAGGLNVIEVEAVTVSGAKGRDHRALMCGAYVPPDTAVAHAADMYLGKSALAALGRVASTWFDSADLDALFTAMNPLYESTLVKVSAVGMEHDPGTVALLVPAWDRVFFNFQVEGLAAAVLVELVGSASSSWNVTVAADKVVVDGELFMTLEPDGSVQAQLESLAFDFQGIVVEIDGITDDLLAVFPDYKDKLVDMIEDWLEKWLMDYVPGAVDQALGHLADPIGFDLLGSSFEVRFVPSLIDLTPAGIHLGLDLAITGLVPDPSIASPGVVHTPGQEDWPEVEGVRLSLKDDLLNAVFHEAWRSGLTRFTVDQAFLDGYKAEIDLVAGFLGGVLDLVPGTVDPETPIAIKIDSMFPPVADLDLPLAGGIRLGVGDLMLDVFVPEWAGYRDLLSLAVTLRIDGEVDPAANGQVSVTMHAFDVALDVVNDDGTFTSVESYLESTTGALLEALGPAVSSLLGTMPLPSFGGFAIANLHVGTETTDGGIIAVSGDLVEVSQ